MSALTFSANTRNTALAALAGVATATFVKLMLDELAEPVALPARRSQLHEQTNYEQMREAMQDTEYLADMQAATDDFAFADAELL